MESRPGSRRSGGGRNARSRRDRREGASRPDRLQPAELASLGDLELVARGVVEGFLIGLHRSPHRGFSVEFAENRPYNPGDDVRFIDWKVYARSDRYYVKQYEEETNLRAYLLLDTSASMAWCSDSGGLLTKLHYGRILAATLALLLLGQGDAVGLLAFDDEVRTHIGPRGGRTQLAGLLRTLEGVRGGEATDAGGALRDVGVRLRRRGLVILLSDLLVDPDETRLALSYLRHRGHEVLVLHLMDPGERELPAGGDARFFDPETGRELRARPAAVRTRYRDTVAAAIAEWRRDCLRMGADYHLVTTDTPLGRVLGEALEKRARLG